MVRGVLVVAQEMLGHERPHGDGKMRKRRSEGEAHALAAGFARELQERGFLGVAGHNEARLLGELGQGVVPVHERNGELAFDEAREDVLTFLGEDGGGRVVLGVLSGEGLIARLDGA